MGFIGPNGADKTTTIKSILNMLNYNSGDIKLFGLKNEQIGIVMDSPFYVDDWKISDVEKALSHFTASGTAGNMRHC